jgi:hypothetical protein
MPSAAEEQIDRNAGGCPDCKKDGKQGNFVAKDVYEPGLDRVRRTWTCELCHKLDQCERIPFEAWDKNDRADWSARAALEATKAQKLRCPDCGKDTIGHKLVGIPGVGASKQIEFSACGTNSCSFKGRVYSRSVIGELIAGFQGLGVLIVLSLVAFLIAVVIFIFAKMPKPDIGNLFGTNGGVQGSTGQPTPPVGSGEPPGAISARSQKIADSATPDAGVTASPEVPPPLTSAKPQGTRGATSIAPPKQPAAQATRSKSGSPASEADTVLCPKFKKLHVVSVEKDTLVKGDCIEISDDTEVRVAGGKTLGIVASKVLRMGKGVRIVARGTDGDKGGKSAADVIVWNPGNDEQIRAACSQGCKCPREEDSRRRLRGGDGQPGSIGGSLVLIARNLQSVFDGVVIDVSGGAGGSPGPSGRMDCQHSGIQCSSPACSDGTNSGKPGAAGKIMVLLGGEFAINQETLFASAIKPSREVLQFRLVEDPSMFRDEAGRLDERASKDGWNVLSAR